MNKSFVYTNPTLSYKDTYLEGLKEFQREGVHHMEINLEDLRRNFADEVAERERESRGIVSRPDRVPQTIYWLIVDGKYIGRVSIRHTLNADLLRKNGHIGYDVVPSERQKGYGTALLKYALGRAKEMGLKKVLLSCDESNIGSRKIIEGAGGVLENIVPATEKEPAFCRFWITL